MSRFARPDADSNFALFTRAMPAARSGADSPLSVAATGRLRMADLRILPQAPYRQVRRESARTAPIGERRHLAPARSTAERRRNDRADAQRLGGRDIRRVQERLAWRKDEPVCRT